MIQRDRLRTDTILSDVPFSNEELFEDDLLNNNNIETYHTNPFLYRQPTHHVFIPKPPSQQHKCCYQDPVFIGMSLMLIFILAIVLAIVIIMKK